MLEHNHIPSRLGYLIGIVLLLCVIAFLGYKIGVSEGDIRTANIVRKWTAGENETLKDLNKNYIEALQYYQGLLSKAYTLTKDMTLMLKKDTLVIPPVEQPSPSS